MEEKKTNTLKQKNDWNIRPYLAIGLIAFLVIVLSIVTFFLIFRYQGVAANWSKLMSILQPIILGMAVAYLINPIVNFEEKHLLRLFGKKIKNEKTLKKVVRFISVLGALLLLVLIIAVLLNMILPELYRSVVSLVDQLPGQIDAFMALLDKYISGDGPLSGYLQEIVNRGLVFAEDWAATTLLPQMTDLITSLTTGVISVLKWILNFIIGLVVSIYVLANKETFLGQAKKVIYAAFKPEKGNVIIETIRKTHEIFGGFIFGKIVDSAIIGVLCFIGVSLLKMPYALLVSVFVGVTNVIPFFGPFIGAIPCAFLILLVDPWKGITFIIFIFILQQFDGNILGPSILGDTTGLSSFWIIFSILVGGGLFGFMGMLLGVPVFATLYYIIQRILGHALRKKGMPVESSEYTKVESIDPKTKEIHLLQEKPKEKKVRKKRKKQTRKEE